MKAKRKSRLGLCDLHYAEINWPHFYAPRRRCDFKAVKRLRICKQSKDDGGPIFCDMNLCDFHANTTWFHKNAGWTIVGEFTSLDQIAPDNRPNPGISEGEKHEEV